MSEEDQKIIKQMLRHIIKFTDLFGELSEEGWKNLTLFLTNNESLMPRELEILADVMKKFAKEQS